MILVQTDSQGGVVLPGHPGERFLMRKNEGGAILLEPTKDTIWAKPNTTPASNFVAYLRERRKLRAWPGTGRRSSANPLHGYSVKASNSGQDVPMPWSIAIS